MWIFNVQCESKDAVDTHKRSWSCSERWLFRITQSGPLRVTFMLIKWGLGNVQIRTIFWPNTQWLLGWLPLWLPASRDVANTQPHKSDETVDLLPIRKRPQSSSLCTRGLSFSPLNAYLFNFHNFESSLLLCSVLLIIHLFIEYLLGSNHVPNKVIGPENIIMGFAFLWGEKTKPQ